MKEETGLLTNVKIKCEELGKSQVLCKDRLKDQSSNRYLPEKQSCGKKNWGKDKSPLLRKDSKAFQPQNTTGAINYKSRDVSHERTPTIYPHKIIHTRHFFHKLTLDTRQSSHGNQQDSGLKNVV